MSRRQLKEKEKKGCLFLLLRLINCGSTYTEDIEGKDDVKKEKM